MGVQTDSLWISATHKLDEADQKLLTFDSASGYRSELDALESLHQTTREAYDTCIQKRWYFKIPGKEKKIIVRDLLSKTAHWIQVFREAGDQAVQYDPVHAAVPWAGVRFLLQIAINDFDKFNFVVQGAERITRMTARYRVIERIYASHSSAAMEQLAQAMVRIYGAVLEYLVRAKRYFLQPAGGSVRLFKSGLLGHDEFQEILNKMDQDEEEVDRCVRLVQAEISKDTTAHLSMMSMEIKSVSLLHDALKRIEQPVPQMTLQLNKIEDHLNSIQRKHILEWLSSQRPLYHHKTIKSTVLDGTCQWVLQNEHFNKWKIESTNSLLWLHGTQGAGKTCIASTVIEDGLKVSTKTQDFAHAHFYCSRDTAQPQRAKAQAILGCIARQLSSPSEEEPIAAPTVALYKKMHSVDGSTEMPDLDELSQLIKELTEVYSRTTVVIDALDECDRDERADLVSKLEYIMDGSTSLVKFFVTSREEGDLRLRIHKHSGVQVTWLENTPDIEKFVHFETERLVARNELLVYIRGQAKEELKALIKEHVVSNANGMFRWAQLKLQSIRRIRTKRDILMALSEVPVTLSNIYEELYRNALEELRETEAALFQNTLKWMLSITSLVDIDIGEISEDIILDLLANFHTFRFAHLSASNTYAAELGLGAKATATLSETDSYRRGIHDYSLRNWNRHCLHLLPLFRYFLFDDSGPNCPLHCWARSRHRQKMRSIYDDHLLQLLRNYHLSRNRGFLLSCIFGFGEILRIYEYRELDDDVREQCIMAATINKNYDIMRSLIGEAKDQVLQKRVLNILVDNNDIEPLSWFLALVEPRLITEQVIVSANRADKEIFFLLLDHNHELHITAELIEKCGRSDGAIETFLTRAPDIAITPKILQNAISSIEIDALKDILDKNDPSIITCEAIAELGYYGHHHESMRLKMELLLQRGGSIRGNNMAMSRVIHRNPSCEIVKTLLDHGWPINQIILQYAAEWGMSAPFMLLLNAGAKLTPEVIAGGAKNIYDGAAMVKLLVSLLDRPLDDNLWFQMMLRCAQNTWGNPETLQVLLEMKPGLRIPEKNLIAFTKNTIKGNAILDILLEDGRELEMTDAMIESTLRNLDFDETIPKLLDRYHSTEITNQLLLGAVRNGRFGDEMTKLLLHRYATVENPSSEIIEAAIQNGHSGHEISQMLEAHFGHLEFNETHVQAAAGSGSITTLTLVLNRCSVTEATAPILMEAATKGSLAVMKHLLTLRHAAISQKILTAASGNSQCTTDMLKFLWNLVPHIELAPEMFINAADHWYLGSTDFEFLFSRVKDAKMCQQILNAAMSSPNTLRNATAIPIFDLILESRFEIEVTDDIVMDMFNTGYGLALETFLRHKVDIKLSQEMVDKAVELKDYPALKVLIEHGNPRELDLQDAMVAIDIGSW
ncbi:hypothetical protein BJX99DRAFT_270885 [Aspergillus californicus]